MARYILIVASLTDGRITTIDKTLRRKLAIRDRGDVPISHYEERDYWPDDAKSIGELRRLEIDYIRRRFPDAVEVLGHGAPDIQEVVAAALQYGYDVPDVGQAGAA